MIISISGLIGSGKDTIADYLVSQHNFRRESWAGTLKDAVSVVFGWDRELLEGRTEESRNWREVSDPWWSARLGVPVTPRKVLQLWGTEVCRNGYHDEIWIASLENKLRGVSHNIVITDSRFPNEINSVKRMGGIAIRVKRGPNPEWVKDYLGAGTVKSFKEKWPNIHASEFSSIGENYHHVLENDGTITDLYRKINDLLQFHQAAK